jgi:hypothetical protein
MSSGRTRETCPECRWGKPQHRPSCRFGQALEQGRADAARNEQSPVWRDLRRVVAAELAYPVRLTAAGTAELADRVTSAVLAWSTPVKPGPPLSSDVPCPGCGAVKVNGSRLHTKDCGWTTGTVEPCANCGGSAVACSWCNGTGLSLPAEGRVEGS